MPDFTQNLGPRPDLESAESLSLDYEGRIRARRRVILDSGREAGLFLERGRTLAEGDVLRAADGTLALVRCRPEPVCTARAPDGLTLARACWHLGNRHTVLQIGDLWLRFLPDPVLENMVRLLGLEVSAEEALFTPESGAYGHSAAPYAHSGAESGGSGPPGHRHEHGAEN
ncbi:MAG: urease accessory protein UreE [Desulfovibrio sp.]|jgi:urease accessory protein|nr:urease accessory protein UreE [Desulfovibrio sp.]